MAFLNQLTPCLQRPNQTLSVGRQVWGGPSPNPPLPRPKVSMNKIFQYAFFVFKDVFSGAMNEIFQYVPFVFKDAYFVYAIFVFEDMLS